MRRRVSLSYNKMRKRGSVRHTTRKRVSKMKCEEVKTTKYQTRKSPPFHAGQCAGQTKKGKDGTYMSKEGSNGVYKWVKVGSRSMSLR